MNKPNAPKYLLEVDPAGLTSLCDYKEERLENWGSTHIVVVPVVFADGSTGLLPEAQAKALADLLGYNWENEELDFAQVGHFDGSEDEPHIVHAYRKLSYEGGPVVKPYLDNQE